MDRTFNFIYVIIAEQADTSSIFQLNASTGELLNEISVAPLLLPLSWTKTSPSSFTIGFGTLQETSLRVNDYAVVCLTPLELYRNYWDVHFYSFNLELLFRNESLLNNHILVNTIIIII